MIVSLQYPNNSSRKYFLPLSRMRDIYCTTNLDFSLYPFKIHTLAKQYIEKFPNFDMMKTYPSTTIYLGNTRRISNESLVEYCSKFGLILDCSRRLKTADQIDLIDFTFIRFLNAQSVTKFLSIASHTLNSGITLDVRPFDDILHTAVPLHVDRKICIRNLSNEISLNEVKKYLRTFGTIENLQMEMNDQEERRIFVEFDSSATRNKLLKGKIKSHRIRDRVLNIYPFLRPTDVDLYQTEDKHDHQQQAE